jgi:hypothetical protein
VTTPLVGAGPIFSKSVSDLFATVGENGCPDPAVNPMGALQYLNNRRSVIQGCANQKPQIRLADNDLRILTDLTDEISCEVEELMADSGVGKVVIKYSHWIEDYVVSGISINQDLHILIDPIPTHPVVQGVPQDWQIRWGGKVKEVSLEHTEKGEQTITFTALSHRDHTKHLLFGANPFFPPELQLPKMWVLPGPLRSIAFASAFVNLARLFVPGLSFITNAFNPASWLNPLNPDAVLNFNPLSWPIQVAFVDTALDNSMWSVLAATWTDFHSTMADLLSNAGCMMRVYTWLTTDATSPHTELTTLISAATEIGIDLLSIFGISTQSELDQILEGASGVLDNLARPTRNCVIISFEDKSGVTGPTGTALDGLLELVGVTLDDLITSVIYDQSTGQTIDGEPVINPNDVSPLFQTLLGIQTAPPRIVYRDGQFTGMQERKVNMHKGPPLTMMTGGRSPSLVNQLQTFGIKYALAELSDVITLNIGGLLAPPGGPANWAQQVPFTPGLDAIYQGQLDNVLFAWERYTDPLRALWTGELAYQEYIEHGSSSAYTLAGFLNLAEAHWKTRAFYGFETKTLNGRPWVYGVDFGLADQLGFEMDAVVYVDQLTAVKFKYDRKQPIFLEMSIGDDKDKHDPVTQGLRIMQGIYGLVGAYLGEGTIFG